MPFPEIDRVIYKKNPLIEVVSQFRFPAILRIRKEPPFEFQEAIAERFPVFEEMESKQVSINYGSSISTTEHIDKVYIFSSEEGDLKVTLKSDSITLTANAYERWEKFKPLFIDLFDQFSHIYNIKNITRVGLRFKNVINLRELGLDDVSWETLINKSIVGCYCDNFISKEKVKEYQGQFILELEENIGYLNAQYGLVKHAETDEMAFLIDGDFFSSTKEDIDAAVKRMDVFKERAHRFFRWSIDDTLHNAMEPEQA